VVANPSPRLGYQKANPFGHASVFATHMAWLTSHVNDFNSLTPSDSSTQSLAHRRSSLIALFAHTPFSLQFGINIIQRQSQ
jgi:hypothetical protein